MLSLCTLLRSVCIIYVCMDILYRISTQSCIKSIVLSLSPAALFPDRVVFDGGPDGEFWYQIQLSADDPSPITLPAVQCELGR